MCDIGDVDLVLNTGANAVSFYALPSDGDYSVSNIFGDDGNVAKVFGEGVFALQDEQAGWIGALATSGIEADDGYWAILNSPAIIEV